jgi:pimeloyl-ACP methyl ester carboxylesterase
MVAAVVHASALKRFALYGTSQGAAVAVVYACRFPECISHLILQGGYESGDWSDRRPANQRTPPAG